ncbi:MAG: FCD domain-containing protein [Corynebacterium sp.]|nr:FCD domain-containing protein [Corynebacterium sp.]
MPLPGKTTSPAPKLDAVLDAIGTDIISGAMATGEKFTLQDLSDRFNISRTVAREAMRALEQLRLVTSSRRVGITVLAPTYWAVFDESIIRWRLADPASRAKQLLSLTQLRIAVEPIAARAMARHGSAESKKRLRRLAETITDLGTQGRGDTDEFLDAVISFHTLLLTASTNEMFATLVSTIAATYTGEATYLERRATPSTQVLKGHHDLAEAIAAGDFNAAERAATAILDEARQKILISEGFRRA